MKGVELHALNNLFRNRYYSAAGAGHSALQQASFLQQESGFWHGVSHAAFAQHSSAFGQSAFFSQHSVAGLSQHLPSLQAAFLQQPIAATAMAAINKIFFMTLKNLINY